MKGFCIDCEYYTLAERTTYPDGTVEEHGNCEKEPPILLPIGDWEDWILPHGWGQPQVWPISSCSRFKIRCE